MSMARTVSRSCGGTVLEQGTGLIFLLIKRNLKKRRNGLLKLSTGLKRKLSGGRILVNNSSVGISVVLMRVHIGREKVG